IGRYGPYVQHKGTYATLTSADEVFDVGLTRAVAALAEKRAGGRGERGAATALKELGPHPATGQPVRVLAGRYGPYVKHEAVNANLPKGADPAAVILEEALALLASREGKGPAKAKPRAKRPAAKAKKKAQRKPAS
ncbi:MAG: topoisomerase C-terminal repeat-containing protein, partial [Caulobacteraceae bacterium]